MLVNMAKIVLLVWLILFALVTGMAVVSVIEQAYYNNEEVIHEGFREISSGITD